MKYAMKNNSGNYVRAGGGWTRDAALAMTFDTPTGWVKFAVSNEILQGEDGYGPTASPAREWWWGGLTMVGLREKIKTVVYEEVPLA